MKLCDCSQCGGRPPCPPLDVPKFKMPTHEEWREHGTDWYISRLQWRLEQAEALLNAALSSAPQGWRGIKDAPKDGTHWQLWDVDDECATRGYWRVDTRYEAGGFWQDYYKANCVVRASHYMPLPAAPATKPTTKPKEDK